MKKKVLFSGLLRMAIFAALTLMVCFVFINAILRYCFNSGWPASEELSRFLFVWVTMLGTIIAYQRAKHVGVDLVIKQLKGKYKKVVLVFSHVITLIAISILAYGGVKYFNTVALTPAPATKLPMGIMALALLVCSFSMLFITLKQIVDLIKDKSHKETK